jgi:hypothetical protein
MTRINYGIPLFLSRLSQLTIPPINYRKKRRPILLIMRKRSSFDGKICRVELSNSESPSGRDP